MSGKILTPAILINQQISLNICFFVLKFGINNDTIDIVHSALNIENVSKHHILHNTFTKLRSHSYGLLS